MSDLHACSQCGEAHEAEASCVPDPRIGTVLDGKFELVGVLGTGGMGRVYAGRHVGVGRRVAVKFLLSTYSTNKDLVRRFENEARTAGSLEHENIGAVIDVGKSPDGAHFIVMEYLDGFDCDQLLARDGVFSVRRAVGIMVQVCRGIGVAHQRGIIHRDLKPANLFVCKRADGNDIVKILDFGIAKLFHATAEGMSLGQTTGMVGTVFYMSPEQARGSKTLTHTSDLYTLGVILYELLTAKRAHDGDSVLEVLHNIISTPPKPLEDLVADLPAGLGRIVAKAMATSPSDRFATADEFGAALLPYLEGAVVPLRSERGSIGDLRAVAKTQLLDSGPVSPARAREPAPKDALTTNAPVSAVEESPAQVVAPRRSRGALLAGIGAVALLAGLGGWRFSQSSPPAAATISAAAPPPLPAITAVSTAAPAASTAPSDPPPATVTSAERAPLSAPAFRAHAAVRAASTPVAVAPAPSASSAPAVAPLPVAVEPAAAPPAAAPPADTPPPRKPASAIEDRK